MSGEPPGPPAWGPTPAPGAQPGPEPPQEPGPPGGVPAATPPSWGVPSASWEPPPRAGAPDPRPRPSLRWLAVPVLVVVVAMAAVWVAVASQHDGLRALENGHVSSSQETVPLELVRGATYHVYVPRGSQAVPEACLVASADGSVAVPFGASGPVLDEDPFGPSDNENWSLLGSFESPVEGDAVLACAARPQPGLYVRPDERPLVVLGVTLVGAGLATLLATAAVVVLLLVRLRRRRRIAAWAYGPPPPPSWPGRAAR